MNHILTRAFMQVALSILSMKQLIRFPDTGDIGAVWFYSHELPSGNLMC